MEETTLLGTNFVRNLRFYFSVSILSNSLTKHSFSVGGELSAPRSTFKPPSPASFQPIRGEEVRRWGAPLDSLKNLAVRSHSPGRDRNEGGSPGSPDPHQSPGSAQIPGRDSAGGLPGTAGHRGSQGAFSQRGN